MNYMSYHCCYLLIVFLSPNAIYYIPVDDLFKQVMKVDQAMNKLRREHTAWKICTDGHE